jgi:hypothetical protein
MQYGTKSTKDNDELVYNTLKKQLRMILWGQRLGQLYMRYQIMLKV